MPLRLAKRKASPILPTSFRPSQSRVGRRRHSRWGIASQRARDGYSVEDCSFEKLLRRCPVPQFHVDETRLIGRL